MSRFGVMKHLGVLEAAHLVVTHRVGRTKLHHLPEPASRVEWLIDAAADGLTRLKLIHGDLARSPLTWANVKDGWVWTLDSMNSLIETGEPLPRATITLGPAIDDVSGEWHRAQGIEVNNSIWDLLASSERTPDDDEEMVRRAYTSMSHWARAAGRGPENEARGEYMLARVQVAVGRVDLGLHHARRCMASTMAAGLADFDLAYAHEAMARALELSGDPAAADASMASARSVPIADPEDQEILDGDLAVPLR